MSDNADKIKKVESNVIYLYDQNNNDFLTIENNIVTLDVRNKINPRKHLPSAQDFPHSCGTRQHSDNRACVWTRQIHGL